jgi:hypothetical protein
VEELIVQHALGPMRQCFDPLLTLLLLLLLLLPSILQVSKLRS